MAKLKIMTFLAVMLINTLPYEANGQRSSNVLISRGKILPGGSIFGKRFYWGEQS